MVQLQNCIQGNATLLFIPGLNGSETALFDWASSVWVTAPFNPVSSRYDLRILGLNGNVGLKYC